MKLTDEQIGFFETFGYLVLRQCFNRAEMDDITQQTESLLAELCDDAHGETQMESPVGCVEHRPALAWLIDDDRVYQPLVQLLGEDMVWGGSEIQRSSDDEPAEHWFHCDRRNCIDLNLTWAKCMLYLQPMTKDTGALRVMPGSHVPAYARRLMPIDQLHIDRAVQTLLSVRPRDLPCEALETTPGDLVIFNQFLFHGVFNKRPNRSYIAIKFIQKPATAAQVEACWPNGQISSRLSKSLRNSDRPRIRKMVEGLFEAERLADMT